jgi:hypothetical protein
VRRAGLLVPLAAEEAVEPALTQRLPGSGRLGTRPGDGDLQLTEGDALDALVARDSVGLAGELGLELVPSRQQCATLVVERGGELDDARTELVAVTIGR